MRAATVTPQLAGTLSRRGSKSVTIAIESGSDRMRRVVNKKLSREEISAAAWYAKEGGLKSLKLYGMVGLPTEQDDDIEATADLLLDLKKQTPGLVARSQAGASLRAHGRHGRTLLRRLHHQIVRGHSG